ncbi:MAG: hypothetical protein MI924_12785 [Chloroflexales bacterium]|nr:hypothetical protein [Chloroflexales bacterium]
MPISFYEYDDFTLCSACAAKYAYAVHIGVLRDCGCDNCGATNDDVDFFAADDQSADGAASRRGRRR